MSSRGVASIPALMAAGMPPQQTGSGEPQSWHPVADLPLGR